MTCRCPDGYPKYVDLKGVLPDGGVDSSPAVVRWEKHTGACNLSDRLQVHDIDVWHTVWGPSGD